MTASGSRLWFAIVTALLVVVGVLQPCFAAAATTQQWNFRVLLDDRDIGYHHFELRPVTTGFQMQTRAEFEVRVLLVKAYDYQHRNLETWRSGCLANISARTESNGERYQVDGLRTGDQFTVATLTGKNSWRECVGSFAYWDRQLLQRGRLLNPQTGDLLAVKFEQLSPATMTFGERTLKVNRYRLTGKDLDIIVTYTADGDQWVALDSVLESGRILRYRRVAAELPPGGAKLAASTGPMGTTLQ